MAPQPLTSDPTLEIVPSISIPTENAAAPLAPIPAEAAAKIATIVDQAANSNTAPTATAPLSTAPTSSLLDDEDIDLELEEFLAPPSVKDKGKGKSKVVASAPASPGPSGEQPAILKRQGFLPQKAIARYSVAEHKATTRNVDALAMGLVEIDGRMGKLTQELQEGLAGVQAQMLGLAADVREASSRAPPHDPSLAIPSLITASNQHTANNRAIQAALGEILARISVLEKAVAPVTSLSATVDSLEGAVRAILSRQNGPVDTPSTLGKRDRVPDATDDAADKRHHPGVAVPAIFSLPTAPPAPDFAAPPLMQPAAVLPIAHAPMPAPQFAPTPAPAPAPQGRATGALPRAPPSGPPRGRVEPARQVLFGPLDWEKWTSAPRNLILSVLGHATMRTARFSSYKGPDEQTAILSFDAENVAQWFTATWNSSPRVGYEVCTARPMSLNA